jgi:hypothetical protein
LVFISAVDVLKVPEGEERDAAISEWCRVVWEAFQENRQTIIPVGGSSPSCCHPSPL